eukprot:3933600-Rhodomonas_salina.4
MMIQHLTPAPTTCILPPALPSPLIAIPDRFLFLLLTCLPFPTRPSPPAAPVLSVRSEARPAPRSMSKKITMVVLAAGTDNH